MGTTATGGGVRLDEKEEKGEYWDRYLREGKCHAHTVVRSRSCREGGGGVQKNQLLFSTQSPPNIEAVHENGWRKGEWAHFWG